MAPSRLLLGVFDSEEKILKAARAAQAARLPLHDAFTPFPVHGMDEALGIGPSHLPRACFAFGLTGLVLIVVFMYWVSLFDWPMNIGGKSYDASPALVPIAFEITVLFAGVGTVLAFFVGRRLFPGKPSAHWELGSMDDRFLLAMRVGPEGAGHDRLARFLREQGALEVVETATHS